MGRYLWRLAKRIPGVLWFDADRAERVISVVGFLLALLGIFNRAVIAVTEGLLAGAVDFGRGLPWWSGVVVAGFLLLYGFAKAGAQETARLDQQIADRDRQVVTLTSRVTQLEARLSPQLDLVFDPADHFCMMEEPINWHGQPIGVRRTFRLGVLNRGGQTVHSVRVILYKIEPPTTPHAPGALVLTQETTDTGGDSTHGITVHPGGIPTVYAMVAGKASTGNMSRFIHLAWADGTRHDTLEPGAYAFTIGVEGENTPAVYRQYRLEVDREGVLWMRSVEPGGEEKAMGVQ